MVKLGQLIPILCDSLEERAAFAAHADREVTAVVNDSRRAVPGALFVALCGSKSDGHLYVHSAVQAGAAYVLSERRVTVPSGALSFVSCDARRRMSALAAAFHGRPTERLHVTGVTGTNGKTTTTYRLRDILQAAGHPTGLVGTIAYQIGERHIPAPNTTPESPLLQQCLAEMLAEGLTHAVMEVSSHALALDRVADVRFSTAVFTNLSDHEHIDYHGTPERYRAAKARLFEMLPSDGFAVINADDKHGQYMADRARCRKIWFGVRNSADVTARICSSGMAGTTYELTTPAGTATVRSQLVGEFNVMNDLAAAAAALAARIELDVIVRALEAGEPVPGRMERIPAPDFFPLVDYAHNEGALKSVLQTVRELAPRRLLVVFGCGGDRDADKRPAMGVVAETYADLIFLTADNSRGEKTEDIIRQIEAGMSGSKPRRAIPDREKAIAAAVEAAEPGDVLVVAGKGHETYQTLGSIQTLFDDREVLRDAVIRRTAPVPAPVSLEA